MAKTIKKHKEMIFTIAVGLLIAITGIVGMYGALPIFTGSVEAATTATVNVSAQVREWASLTSSSTATLVPDLVDYSGNEAVGSTTGLGFIAKSNSGDGYSVTVEGDGSNQLTGSVSGSIASVAAGATSTVVAGTDNYGIQATSTESTVASIYDNWGDDIMGPVRAAVTIVNHGAPTDADGHLTNFRIAAACDGQQASGAYTDTITLTILASP